jgi:hypothetical protein
MHPVTVHRKHIRQVGQAPPHGGEQDGGQYEAAGLGDEEGRPRVAHAPHHPRRKRHARTVRQEEDAEHGRKQIGVELPDLPHQPHPDDFQRNDHVAREKHEHAPQRQPAIGRGVRRGGSSRRLRQRPQRGHERQRQEGCEHIECCRDPERTDKADMADDHPSADQSPKPGAKRIEAVEHPDPLGDGFDPRGDGAREERQRRAHQRRRQHEASEAEREDRNRIVHDTRQVRRQPVVQERLGQDGKAGDADFAQGEGDQRPRRRKPVGDPRADQRPEPEPREKGADDERRRNGVRSGEDAEHPLPDDLEKQGGKARGEKGDRKTRHAKAVRDGRSLFAVSCRRNKGRRKMIRIRNRYAPWLVPPPGDGDAANLSLRRSPE